MREIQPGQSPAINWMTSVTSGLVLVMSGPSQGRADTLEYLLERARQEGQNHLGCPGLTTLEELKAAMEQAKSTVVYADYPGEGDLCARLWTIQDEHSSLEFREELAEVVEAVFIQRLHTAKTGVVQVSEVLLDAPMIRGSLECSHSSFQLRSHLQRGFEVGMQVCEQSLLSLWKEGVLSQEEVYQFEQPHQDAKRLIEGNLDCVKRGTKVYQEAFRSLNRGEQIRSLNLLYQHVSHEKALECLKTLIRLDTKNSGRYEFEIGVRLVGRGKIDSAVQHFQTALLKLDEQSRAHFQVRAALCLWRVRPRMARTLAKEGASSGTLDRYEGNNCNWVLEKLSSMGL